MTDEGNGQDINLCAERGDTSVYINVRITQEGDLQLYGQDIGKAPKELFGDSDYEYWLTIPREHKDRVLLLLIKELYGGDSRAVTAFRRFAESNGIPCKFENWA